MDESMSPQIENTALARRASAPVGGLCATLPGRFDICGDATPSLRNEGQNLTRRFLKAILPYLKQVRGLLLLGCGESGIRFTPPLCINRVQLEVGLDVFDEVVATVSA